MSIDEVIAEWELAAYCCGLFNPHYRYNRITQRLKFWSEMGYSTWARR